MENAKEYSAKPQKIVFCGGCGKQNMDDDEKKTEC